MSTFPISDNAWLFDFLGRIAKGIVSVVGPNCEVVVHDFSNLNHSAVIVAGCISGRKPGAPVPDLGIITETLNTATEDEINYKIIIGDKEFQSSTIWIRDYENNIIGAVCINLDFSKIKMMKEIINELSQVFQEKPSLIVSNTFAKNLDELLHNTVTEFIKTENIKSLEEMKIEEKLNLIRVLESRGLFKIRGATQRLGDILKVSRASIYNYRSGIQEK
jgi:predicted transcriptional regulator YheO